MLQVEQAEILFVCTPLMTFWDTVIVNQMIKICWGQEGSLAAIAPMPIPIYLPVASTRTPRFII